MIEVLDSTKQAYLESHHKVLNISIPNINLTLTNANIVYESLDLQESIETEEQLQFKGCNASQFKVSVAGVIQDIRDEYIEVTITADNTETIPLFSGYVVEQTNRNGEDITTELTCYDPLYKIRKQDVTSWYNGLTFPITMKNFRNSFFTLLGIEQVVDVHSEEATGDLINDSQPLKKIDSAKLPKVLNAGKIMEDICQCNARYGQYGRDKKFHYRQLREIIKGLYPSYETYPTDENGWTDPDTGIYYPPIYPSAENADAIYNLAHYSKIQYEPYTVEKIDGVTIRDNVSDSNKQTHVTHYGNNTNVFEIADNFLASSFSNKATACQNLLGELEKIWYIPLKLDCVGFPWVECGDILLSRTKKNIVRCYVLQRTLKGIQALFDTIESEGIQYREKYTESEETKTSTNTSGIRDNYLRVNRIETNTLVAQMVDTNQLSAKYIRGGGGDFGYLNANCIQAGTITTEMISTNGLNASVITAGYLNVDVLQAKSISYQKLSGWNNAGYLEMSDLKVTNSLSVKTLQVLNAGDFDFKGDYIAKSSVTIPDVGTIHYLSW